MRTRDAVPSADPDLRLLVGGLVISGTLIGLGLVGAFAGGHGLPTTVVPLGQIVRRLADGEPAALLSAGFLCLIATPVLRLALSIVQFWRAGDRRFALVALTVLLTIFAGLVIGHR
ncbi:MAG: DUF1634 domain-containing protein [Candidatus Sericytochromatia bacterium]|nr:DUF1634 domain-containing protein [Candidatus Sericytochromatia bacterium]